MNDDGDESPTRIKALRAAIDEGLAELDAGRGVETTPEDFVAEVLEEIGAAE